MDPLDQILERALKLAGDSNDADTMLKVVQLAGALGEMRERQLESGWSGTARKIGPAVAAYTAILATLLSSITLAFQFYQFGRTQRDQSRREEQSQWREALKNISIKDDSSVFSSALQMQTFFPPASPYSKQSRSVAVALLPLLGSGDQFDTIGESMGDYTTPENTYDLISAARSVASEDYALFSRQVGITGSLDRDAKLRFIDFLINPESFWNAEDNTPPLTLPNLGDKGISDTADSHSTLQNQYAFDLKHNPLKRAQANSWKIDSASQGLGYLWKRSKGALGPARLDLKGVVLVNSDYRDLNFSGATVTGIVSDCRLAGADFTGATLEEAVFDKISDFANSRWDRADWWDADALSCGLAHYLATHYPPPAEAERKAKSLEARCRPASSN